jgi:hypothetical protein
MANKLLTNVKNEYNVKIDEKVNMEIYMIYGVWQVNESISTLCQGL